jgi:hypothetical protein
MDNAPSMLKSAAIGGSVLGLAAGLPLVGMINCACCALVIGAGFLAAFLYSRECNAAGAEFRPGNGAVVGLVAAPFYAAVSTLLKAIFSPFSPEQFDEAIAQLEDSGLDPEAIDMAARIMENFSGGLGILFGLFLTLIIAAVFSTVGGLIGGAVFRVEPSPPPSGMTPPPSPPPAPPVAGGDPNQTPPAGT